MSKETIISDQRLANESAACEQAMKLGAVILKPAGHQPIGFAPQPEKPTSE